MVSPSWETKSRVEIFCIVMSSQCILFNDVQSLRLKYFAFSFRTGHSFAPQIQHNTENSSITATATPSRVTSVIWRLLKHKHKNSRCWESRSSRFAAEMGEPTTGSGAIRSRLQTDRVDLIGLKLVGSSQDVSFSFSFFFLRMNYNCNKSSVYLFLFFCSFKCLNLLCLLRCTDCALYTVQA